MSQRRGHFIERRSCSGHDKDFPLAPPGSGYRGRPTSHRSDSNDPASSALNTPRAEQPWIGSQSSLPSPAQAYFENQPGTLGPIDYHPGSGTASSGITRPSQPLERGLSYHPDTSLPAFLPGQAPNSRGQGFFGQASRSEIPQHRAEPELEARSSPDLYSWEQDSSTSRDSLDFLGEPQSSRTSTSTSRPHSKGYSQRRPSNRDEFDGPSQYLNKPSPEILASQERDLPHIPTNLFVQEQDDLLTKVNDRLSQCAFDFVAKYQFPIPLEADKRPVRIAQDREWTEWVYLLKRLATKRRIPARVLYNGQIKQLVTVLENSLEMRHAAKHQSRPLKDDRNVLQLISAGLQVAKILKDAASMEFLDQLYVRTELLIQSRRGAPTYLG